ncbi:alpha-protein kinase vwkA-like [Patiria miniata]|uniref:Alpha-type protein kinase domain-containing protein n=1 Tax=Patiria miniata TaxID=46514 RepID=A0A914AF24_PATMI|nr:alpha-protein kinase vwkA-like [Patiria miniata]
MTPEGASVTIESLVQGRYVKFLNNFGYVNPSEDTLVPEAFSHFTYHESNGEILVTDLQGVYNQTRYVFTDPAIHSIEIPRYTFGHYGPTDLGVFGVMKFFQNHKCNLLCDGLRIPEVSKVSDYWKEDLHRVTDSVEFKSDSTYTYELQNVGLPAQRIQELHNNVAETLALSGRHGKQLNGTR